MVHRNALVNVRGDRNAAVCAFVHARHVSATYRTGEPHKLRTSITYLCNV